MDFDLRPKRLDAYIVKKFITTFFVALLLIIGIVIIFDISEKIDDFVSKEAPLKAVIFDYYVNFVPYFMNMSTLHPVVEILKALLPFSCRNSLSSVPKF